MQLNLIKLYWINKHLEFSTSDSSRLFGSIYALSKIIHLKYLEFAFPKYFSLFRVLRIEKKLLTRKWTPNSWNWARSNSRWCNYWYCWSIDCHCGYKPYPYNQVPCLTICHVNIHLFEAHEASNSVLKLFSWVEEHSLSSHMFKYWMLIDKLRIDYLAFIGSMRKDNVKLFAKILISLVNWFFIFKHYNYC